MIYFIVGSIIVLFGLGLMRIDMGNGINYLGMLLFIIGLFIIFKGRHRGKLDK
jgi:hypothetical protein